MRLTFVQLALFVRHWYQLGLTDEDLQALEQLISENPSAGAVMRGTGGLRKVRFAPPSWHRGKSGAARVCYVVYDVFETAYLVSLFATNEQANLSDANKAAARALLRRLEAGLKRRGGSHEEGEAQGPEHKSGT